MRRKSNDQNRADNINQKSFSKGGFLEYYRSFFSQYIEEKAAGFIGRKFVFDALDRFMQKSDSGYFIVRGDPGIGKTSFIAYLVKTRGYVYHFNISTQGINRSEQFLGNVCGQLITKYRLNKPILMQLKFCEKFLQYCTWGNTPLTPLKGGILVHCTRQYSPLEGGQCC